MIDCISIRLWLLIHSQHLLNASFYLRADMFRGKTLALITKPKQNIVIVISFKEWIPNDIVLIAIRQNILFVAVVQHPFQNGLVDAERDRCLLRVEQIGNIQFQF